MANSTEVKNFSPSVFLSRVLLRVRMLYYLRQEVIGDQAEKILEGADSRLVQAHVCSGLHRPAQVVRKLHCLCSEPSQTLRSSPPFCVFPASVCPLGLGVGGGGGQGHLHVLVYKRERNNGC